jgi:hypothetical protein
MTGKPNRKIGRWKEIIAHEMAVYWVNVLYLSLVFAAFTQYRRLLLAAHDINYTNYWIAVIEALILAKVIMIGDALHLARGLDEKPLIFPTVYKTFVFSFFVGVFTVVEYAIKGVWQGKGLAGGVADFVDKGLHELLAGCLVIFVALLPFFAVKELARVIGVENMRNLFFRRKQE